MGAGRVLITGATGHIGFRTLVLVLQAGYYARIAVRKLQQSDKIKSAKSVSQYFDQIEFTEVPDITTTAAYDNATEGVKFIVHVASPLPMKAEHQQGNWQEIYYDPAIKGTLSILEAAIKTPSVEAVVITSSTVVLPSKDFAGPEDIMQPADLGPLDDVTDFNEAYVVSKVLAHDAATQFVKKNNPKFRLIRVLPGYVQGPHELIQNEQEFFTGSNEGTINAVIGNLSPEPKPNSQVWLEDVAKAHVLALDPKVGKDGAEFVMVGNGGVSVPWDEVAETASKLFPEAFRSGILKPVKGQQNIHTTRSTVSSERALGFKFASTAEMIKGLIAQWLELHGHQAQ